MITRAITKHRHDGWRAASMALAIIALALALALLAVPAWSESNAPDDATHLGVATCASSTCHGRVQPDEDSPVALNEYFIWSKYDAHARAHDTLNGEWSQRIAANMGLGDAASAEQCLVCHTDYVPPTQRGERFQVSDGIGCEACHGGAEHWIDSHYGPSASHADNLEQGLNPTEEPAFQARLCQSCHIGDDQRLASHEMMAAGHPRLRFELDTWLTNMHPHHIEDADYIERKSPATGVDRWAAGIVTAAGTYLDRLAEHIGKRSLLPELALFDCHACHRPMDTGVRRSAVDKRLLPAGAVRPDDHALRVLTVVVALRDAQLARSITAGTRQLHTAATRSAAVFLDRASRLRDDVWRAHTLLTQRPLTAAERAQLRRELLQSAAEGYFRDYADAEQLYLALQTLAAQSPVDTTGSYDTLFGLLDAPEAYEPRRLAAEARRLLKVRR